MIGLILLAALGPQDPTYVELSRKQGLASADRLMRDGKFLEAAVGYRNVLLTPGEREAVRVPLALALLAKGDAVYAGIEIRRAHMLYPDFTRLVLEPTELFGSAGILTRAADVACQRDSEGDGAEVDAIAAYAYFLEGERERALAALGRYAQSRGEDAFARDLKAAVSAKPGAAAAVKPAVPVAVPVAAPASSGPAPKGEAVKAGVRYREPEVRPLGEILSK
jgi:hypothetical protein